MVDAIQYALQYLADSMESISYADICEQLPLVMYADIIIEQEQTSISERDSTHAYLLVPEQDDYATGTIEYCLYNSKYTCTVLWSADEKSILSIGEINEA